MVLWACKLAKNVQGTLVYDMNAQRVMGHTQMNTKVLNNISMNRPSATALSMLRTTRMVILPVALFHHGLPMRISNGSNNARLQSTAKNSRGDGEDENTNKRDDIMVERGVRFVVGDSFFREESAIGRDLGVLAGALYKKKNGKLRVLDAMCGCGVRALRYLVQANADFVWANDANEYSRPTILTNLSQEEGFLRNGRKQHLGHVGDEKRWVITHNDANRVLADRYLQGDYYDLIDVDSFGSDSSFLGSALSALRYGGLLYLTSTDGFSSGGHRPHNSLTSYGAYIKPMPYANEVGLRMLIGGAVREAAIRNMDIWPVFSYFSYHGPVFRVMLRVTHGKPQKNRHYRFISYCTLCGDSQPFSWDDIGVIACLCSGKKVSRSLVVSGPLWTGPLHSGAEIENMLKLAEEWGWVTTSGCYSGPCSSNNSTSLNKLLNLMIGESNPELPSGFIKLDEIASRGKMDTPRRDDIIDILQTEGYVACRSHIAPDVIKTNCPMVICIKLAFIHQNKLL